ncbi:MAG: hypothetical protein HY708_03550 [Ignavibacteriae bacterium]|nr:hypothetical protein [Ignavibacteriota bacterium]
MITKTATNFEESAPVSKDHFAIPANMKIHDAGDRTEMLKKMKKKGKG